MKKILLIEDNKDVRDNTSEILKLAGYSVTTASNGKEGVSAVQKDKPDLVICDIMMPELDGYGVLHLLSKNNDTAGIPFIFLTAKAERSDMRKGMEMGADDYITKPFDDIELLNAIESRLRKAELVKTEFSKDLDGLNEFIANARSFSDLQKLTEKHESRICRKKENIYIEGNYPKGLYFIVKGKVKTHRMNEQGKEFITGLFKEGDFFGYHPLLEEGKYSDFATALEDSEICLVPKEDFYSLIYKNAEVSRKFIKMLSDNLREKEEELIHIAYDSVRKRVAEALLKMSERYKKDNVSPFSMNIAREDLANLAGAGTETTIRTLSDFKDEGLIHIKGSVITVAEPDKLAKMRN